MSDYEEMIKAAFAAEFAAGRASRDAEVEALRAELAARPVPAPTVPDGWKLVPLEPTLEMLATGDAVWVDAARVLGCTATKSLYKAMLAAAPKGEQS